MAGVGAVSAAGAGAGVNVAGPGPVGGVSSGMAAGKSGASTPAPAAAQVSPASVVKLSGEGVAASKGLGEVPHSGGGTYNASGLSDAMGLGASSSPFTQSLTQSARAVGDAGASDKTNVNGQSYESLNSMDPAIAALLLMLAMQEKKKDEGAGVSIAVSIDIKV